MAIMQAGINVICAFNIQHLESLNNFIERVTGVVVRGLPEKRCIRFAIRDTGGDIPKEYQSQVFDKYFQVSGSRRQGTGRGLTIAKNIIAAHGGRDRPHERPGQGSTFWFTLT